MRYVVLLAIALAGCVDPEAPAYECAKARALCASDEAQLNMGLGNQKVYWLCIDMQERCAAMGLPWRPFFPDEPKDPA